MRCPLCLFLLVLLLPDAAAARAAPAASAASAAPLGVYLGGGVTGGGIDGYENVQGFVDGGFAIGGRWLWLHARLGAGTLSDTEAEPPWSHEIASAVVGLEARGCARFVCAVGGLDFGGIQDFHDSHLDPDFDLHLGLEVGLGDTGVALRVALGLNPGPSATAGLLVRL